MFFEEVFDLLFFIRSLIYEEEEEEEEKLKLSIKICYFFFDGWKYIKWIGAFGMQKWNK